MVGRSQRHMQEIQGVNASGNIGLGGPAITGISPDAASVAAAGAVDRTLGTFTVVGGTAPLHWSIAAAAGVSAQFVGNLLKTTVNPAGTVALHTMSITVSDQRGMSKTENFALTLT
jgi:hypothetical protein